MYCTHWGSHKWSHILVGYLCLCSSVACVCLFSFVFFLLAWISYLFFLSANHVNTINSLILYCSSKGEVHILRTACITLYMKLNYFLKNVTSPGEKTTNLSVAVFQDSQTSLCESWEEQWLPPAVRQKHKLQ